MEFDYEVIKNMVKASANYCYDWGNGKYYARYILVPSWVTEKPLSLEGCDYDGNEAVYDWMLKNNIQQFELEDGKFKFMYDNEVKWHYIEA